MAGQSIMDRVVAARHSIAGQGLAKSVCKATTEEIIGPKKKHLDYLLQCTNEPNVSIPQMADLLIERTQQSSWVVVFKSLVSIHNLMNYGNERFTQYLASNNCSFNLSGFVDKGGVQGYDMSTYIRRYAKYLNEKAVSYRLMAFDFCKVKRGKEDGLLRTMNSEKLIKTLPVLQQQLDALLEFDCTPNELTNGVITACFMLLFKDLIRLFACYNDGIINLLEKYFDMNKKQCKDALDLYKKFLVRMDKVSEFLKVAENMGIDKGDIPDLAKAPASLLDALDQHLASLEGKKGVATTPTNTSKPAGFASALNTMTTNTFNVSEAERKKILDEESQYMQKLKEQKAKESPVAPPSASPSVVPAQSPVSTPQANLLGSPTGTPAVRPSDDLLSLAGNSFTPSMQSAMASAYNPTPPAPASTNPFGTPAFQTNGYGAAASAAGSSNFTSEADFDKVFNSQAASQQGFDKYGDVLTPMNKSSPSHTVGQGQAVTPALSTDLDTSLSSLATNLTVGGGNSQLKKDHQWQPKGDAKLTGGNAFARQPLAQSTMPAQQTWIQPNFQQTQMGTPMMYAQPMTGGMANVPMMQAPMMGMPQQPMGMPAMYGAPQRMPMMSGFQQPPQNAQQNNSNVNDPFGAL